MNSQVLLHFERVVGQLGLLVFGHDFEEAPLIEVVKDAGFHGLCPKRLLRRNPLEPGQLLRLFNSYSSR